MSYDYRQPYKTGDEIILPVESGKPFGVKGPKLVPPVRSYPKPSDQWIALRIFLAAGTAQQAITTSTPIRYAIVVNSTNSAAILYVGPSPPAAGVLAAGTAPGFELPVGAGVVVDIDDLSKLYGRADPAGNCIMNVIAPRLPGATSPEYPYEAA